ncbi:hypothetical protein [Natranaerobius trueperi]|uniref:hypothetical protein n=1 Tax=Natranaerobius trueperi TaxID=759412 RepID=UPI00197B43FD|nr:hypothetical protein [Natranaerobius trueperi]
MIFITLNICVRLKRIITSKFEKVISQSFVVVSFMIITCKLYQRVVAREISKAEISSNDRVLLIGGGALPYTAVLINKLTGAKVDVVDSDTHAYQCAKALHEKYYRDSYFPYCMCGKDCEFERYNAILIARQIEKKDEIINRIVNKSRVNTKVIVRDENNLPVFLPDKDSLLVL